MNNEVKVTIVSVRHGKTVMNIEKTMSGWTDIKLSDEGIADLEAKKKTTNYPKTDRYYTSALTRAKDTFDILFGDIATCDGHFEAFNEIFFGGVEGLPISEVVQPFYASFIKNEPYLGGETLDLAVARMMGKLTELVDQLVKDNFSSLTIVGHSGTSRIFDFVLNNRPNSEYRTPSVDNGLGYVFEVMYSPETKAMRLIHQWKLTN